MRRSSRDGLIDASELRDGLAQLAAPGGIASQVARRKRGPPAQGGRGEAARRADLADDEEAAGDGAAGVLRIINAAMVARGQRLKQIFVLLDRRATASSTTSKSPRLRKLVNPGRGKARRLEVREES